MIEASGSTPTAAPPLYEITKDGERSQASGRRGRAVPRSVIRSLSLIKREVYGDDRLASWQSGCRLPAAWNPRVPIKPWPTGRSTRARRRQGQDPARPDLG